MDKTNQELSQEFYIHFNAAQSELASRANELNLGSADSKALQQLSTDFAKLRKELTDATSFLPSYDQRQCELRLKEVEGSLEKLRTAAAPKPKFVFKRKANTSTTSPSPSSTSSASKVAPITSALVDISSSTASSFAGVTLSGRSHEFLDLSSLPSAVSATDLIISDLDHCVVYMLSETRSKDGVARDVKITALHARNIRNSVLIMPVIDGSALLHDLSRCVLALGCHQYRMHSSTQTDVYISLASNPIIEHCKGIRFTKYPRYLHSAGDELPSNLAVQDFSHIRPTPSPNWSNLPEGSIPPEESWPKHGDSDNVEVDRVLQRLLPSST
ncbi:tubulin binding cofactor C-domain-containing protein [Fomitopsis serialis]|uniref:tubulin binding cofactor C-domain-containing protein n=1 Tax=Fomitopsis serialis TaxID=139415 RepID=UPI002008BCA5|nr:tubulin binding cofactor C-domain-containing protein [Neoantrodia serialis]KAH9926063.1 tubulin binding cofactor C-domain-containing protein [Neoantrodia serialis]